MPNSGTLVLPMMMAPLFPNPLDENGVLAGHESSSGEPQVVRRPRVGARSFTACGKPCIQPRRWPRASSRSRSSASSSSVVARLERNDGVDLGVEALDVVQECRHHFAAGNPFGGDGLGES